MLHHNLLLSTAWDGSSVWDLPIDSMAQAPTIEQMQQYEKAKTAKVNTLKKSCSRISLLIHTVSHISHISHDLKKIKENP